MQIAASGDTLTPTREQALAIRVLACVHLELLNGLLLGGSLPFNFPHDIGQQSVQDHLDGQPLIEVIRILPPGCHPLLLRDKQGSVLANRAVTSLRHGGLQGGYLSPDGLDPSQSVCLSPGGTLGR